MAAPLPQLGTPLAEQDPKVLLAMAIFGESRGEIMPAKIGVGSVIRNRVFHGGFGWGWPGVILKPYQFSSFNSNDPNSTKLMEPTKHEAPEVWEECYSAAELVFGPGKTVDTTGGAVYYYSAPLYAPPKKHDGTCAWGNVLHTVDIGGLHFYREA